MQLTEALEQMKPSSGDVLLLFSFVDSVPVNNLPMITRLKRG